MKTLLELTDLSLFYQTANAEIKAIDSLNLDVYEGEFVAIIGRSGCGKTSILSVVAGLLPYEGDVKILSKKVDAPGKNVGYMLQRDELFDWLTIEENVYLPLKIRRQKRCADLIKNVEKLTVKYGLGGFMKCYPNELSGGMRQRAALIRTLVLNPDLLLLDEPFSALDYQTRLAVCDDVYSIIKNEKKTALLVTHDISEAISVADRVVVLSARPAKVSVIREMPFDKTLTPLHRRECPEFSSVFEQLWRDLNK